MDFDIAERTMNEVVATMLSISPKDAYFPREWWPGACCEQTTTAIAAVLEDKGLLGWTYITAGRPGEGNGHAWLEYRDDHGRVVYSIDATLHQFTHLATEPWAGLGPSPAAGEFTDIRYAGPWHEWKYIGREDQVFYRNIIQIRDRLASPRLGSQPN